MVKLIELLLSLFQTLNEKLKPFDLRITNLESKYVRNKLPFFNLIKYILFNNALDICLSKEQGFVCWLIYENWYIHCVNNAWLSRGWLSFLSKLNFHLSKLKWLLSFNLFCLFVLHYDFITYANQLLNNFYFNYENVKVYSLHISELTLSL